MAVRQLEHRAALRRQVEQGYKAGHAVALSNAIHSFLEPMMVLDISQPQQWRILAVNQAWTVASGIYRSVRHDMHPSFDSRTRLHHHGAA